MTSNISIIPTNDLIQTLVTAHQTIDQVVTDWRKHKIQRKCVNTLQWHLNFKWIPFWYGEIVWRKAAKVNARAEAVSAAVMTILVRNKTMMA
jgi:hypothetical protein